MQRSCQGPALDSQFPIPNSPQEHTEIVKPANFATVAGSEGKGTGLLAPIFGQIAKWFQR